MKNTLIFIAAVITASFISFLTMAPSSGGGGGTGGGGGGITNLPANASGLLENNGSGTLSWDLKPPINGGRIVANSIQMLSLSNAPGASNYIAIINTPNLSNGMFAVFTGQTNADGAPQFKGTIISATNIFESSTNLLGVTTVFPLAQTSWGSGSTGIGFTSLGNLPPVGLERWGQLTWVATADCTFSFPTGWKTSAYTNSIVITNGNIGVISVDCQVGIFTNVAIVQFK